MRIRIDANKELYLPHNNRSGTNMNSMLFIVAITSIWTMALKRGLIPLTIHRAISISEPPISFVNRAACSLPKITETIFSCLGTMPSTLQNKPFINQIEAIQYVKLLYANFGVMKC